MKTRVVATCLFIAIFIGSFIQQSNAQSSEDDEGSWFWESAIIECTVTKTFTLGGGVLPVAISYTETHPGTKRTCIDGWWLCISGMCKASAENSTL
ncbi:MAG: hypothetical protein ACJAS3_000435 [Roseivirga sp.]